MKNVNVAAAIIQRDTDGEKEILATQRGHGEYKGWWEFPGGKIEPGETPEEALVREIREELAVEIVVDGLFCSVEYDYPAFHLSMDCFWCIIKEGEPVLLEHKAAKWLSKDRLRQVQWLPADIQIIDMIENGQDPTERRT